MVSFGFRFPFLSGPFVLVSPLHLPCPPLDNHSTHSSKKIKRKKGFFWDAFTYAPLSLLINQPIVLYNSYFIIVFSMHSPLSLLDRYLFVTVCWKLYDSFLLFFFSTFVTGLGVGCVASIFFWLHLDHPCPDTSTAFRRKLRIYYKHTSILSTEFSFGTSHWQP